MTDHDFDVVVGLGILIVFAPSSVPELASPM
jgi:hypothetical protein